MLFAAGYGVALLFSAWPGAALCRAAGWQPLTDLPSRRCRLPFSTGAFTSGPFTAWWLILAYFAYRHGLPLTMRSALYPLIGERIYGPIGHVVDIFAIFGTLFVHHTGAVSHRLTPE